MSQDQDYLKLLSIFHYVLGGLVAFLACFPIFHVVFGLLVVFKPEFFHNHGRPEDALFGWIFVAVGSLCILIGWTCAGFLFATGYFLGRRRHYLFCLVVAGLETTFVPFGTALGICTLIVLMRESVKGLFESIPAPLAPDPWA